MGVEMKLELLKCLTRYYPIGLPYSNAAYPGFKSLLGIVDEKVNSLAAGKRIEPWSDFVGEIASLFPESINDQSYHQSPSLLLSIRLKSISDPPVERRRNMVVGVSLLGAFATIFVTEEFSTSPLSTDKSVLPKTTVWTGNAFGSKEHEKVDTIRTLLSRYYPDHILIPQEVLFRTIIFGAIPHGEDLDSAEQPKFQISGN
jgi:hypothetical protein